MMTMATKREYALFEITPEIEHFAQLCEDNNAIDKELYTKYEEMCIRDSRQPFWRPWRRIMLP